MRHRRTDKVYVRSVECGAVPEASNGLDK